MSPEVQRRLRHLARAMFSTYGPFYTGVGSRSTPPDVQDRMVKIARFLRGEGYTLRTGEAGGADSAFREGAEWWGSRVYCAGDTLPLHAQAEEIAAAHHPAWGACSHWARRLHTRNVYQVLGHTLTRPSQFLICWTPDGVERYTTRNTGGTGQAIRVALAYGVPVLNLGNTCTRKLLSCIGQEVEEGSEVKLETLRRSHNAETACNLLLP